MALKSKKTELIEEEELPFPIEGVTETKVDDQTTDLTIVEHSNAIQNFNVEEALAQWEAYQIFTEKLLERVVCIYFL